MTIHDWTRVPHGIFHHFHHSWIEELMRALNAGGLPARYYALAEQQAAGYGPDVLTLQTEPPEADSPERGESSPDEGGLATATLARPHARFVAHSEGEFYWRKKSSVVIRHVSNDRIVAMVEIVSPGNKASQNAFHAFLEKTRYLLQNRIHLLIIDLLPPTPRDPQGIHSAIWREWVDDEEFQPPSDKPLTLVAYESSLELIAYIEPVAVGDSLPSMPLILEPGGAVNLPLEATYQAAWRALPERWRKVLE